MEIYTSEINHTQMHKEKEAAQRCKRTRTEQQHGDLRGFCQSCLLFL